MSKDKPTPGDHVFKETQFTKDPYNEVRVVPDHYWDRHVHEDEEDEPWGLVQEDEFVTQSMNSMRILDKCNVDEVEMVDGRWEIPYDDEE